MAVELEHVQGLIELKDEFTPQIDKAINSLDTFTKKNQDSLDKVNNAVNKVNHSAGETSGFFKEMAESVAETALGFISAEGIMDTVGEALHMIGEFATESIHAFTEAEAADIKLVAALRQHSIATPEIIAQYKQLGTTFQATTTYMDDEITAMESLLTQVGGVMPSKMKDALEASTNLAAGLGIDLHQATNLVAKAAAGHTQILGRYGITVSDAALETKGFDAVLEAINRQFGGQASAAVETYSGQVKQVSNAWNNVQEAVGKFLVMNPLSVAAMRVVTEAVKGTEDATKEATPTISALADSLGFPASALGLTYLEDYIVDLNDIAKLAKTINELPDPFEKWAKSTSAASDLSRMASVGMKLWEADLKAHEKQVKADEESLKKFNDATVEINASGKGWMATIEELDGAVVEAIKGYLEAGVSQNTLASYYGLTAGQVKAVATQMEVLNEMDKLTTQLAIDHQKEWRDEIKKTLDERNKQVVDGNKQIYDARRQLDDAIAKSSLDTLNYEILNVWKKVDEEEKAFKGSEEQRAQYNEIVEALATEQAQALRDTADAAAAATESAAKRQVGAIKTVIASYWEEVDAAAVAAGATVVGHRPGEPGSEPFAGSAPNASKSGSFSFQPGGQTDPRIATYLGQGYTIGEAAAILGGYGASIGMPHRAGGGSVDAGKPVVVGEERPEVFVPSTSGTILPSVGGPNITNHIYVNGSIKDLARPLVDEITRTLRQSRLLPAA